MSQLDSLKARLSSTERALQEANQRTTELNSRLALNETDARLKVQDLVSKVRVSHLPP